MSESRAPNRPTRPLRSRRRSGTVIAGVGLPGCGKSTIAREFAELVDANVFLEPEANDWPPAVTGREVYGRFTGMSWFRATRIPAYFEADALRSKGRTAILDSYYDKLCASWLGAPGMEWLISPADPYFSIAKELAERDWKLLPPADVIVVFEVDQRTWQQLIKARGRQLDKQFGILRTFATQRYFIEAAEKLASETSARVLRFQQIFDSPTHSAQRLIQALEAEGVRLRPRSAGRFSEIDHPDLRRLTEAAADAVGAAFARHSDFRVGAAVRTAAGRTFTGCNVENDSYGLTSCAERNAVFAAVRAEGAGMTISAVAIYAERGSDGKVPVTVPPCGACRQVLNQFSPVPHEVTVTFLRDGRFATMRMAELLPVAFELGS